MKVRVLVVDDDEHVRRMLSRLIVALGHDCAAVASGREALDVLSRERFEVALLDLRMPGLSGVETWQRICAMPGAHPSGVLVTAASEGASIAAANGLPYLSKPFELDVFRRVLAEAIARFNET